MELKLKTKEKTYTAETFDITFGAVDDLVKALNPDEVDFSDKLELGKAILGVWGQVEPLLMEIFDGVTNEELRTVKMSNIVQLAQQIFAYMSGELNKIGNNEKN